MNIHEYQAKALLGSYGVKVLRGQVAYTPDEAESVARELGGPVWVVKAQIHAGGRGKGGGVKLARSIEEVRQHAEQLLGMTLVTHQTGPEGRLVRRVLIEDGCDIARELYLGAVVDRSSSRVTLMASAEGGVEIEEVAARSPEKILKVAIDPACGFQPFHGRKIAFGLDLEGRQLREAVMRGGRRTEAARDTLDAARRRAREEVERLPARVRALDPAEPPFETNSGISTVLIRVRADPDQRGPSITRLASPAADRRERWAAGCESSCPHRSCAQPKAARRAPRRSTG